MEEARTPLRAPRGPGNAGKGGVSREWAPVWLSGLAAAALLGALLSTAFRDPNPVRSIDTHATAEVRQPPAPWPTAMVTPTPTSASAPVVRAPALGLACSVGLDGEQLSAEVIEALRIASPAPRMASPMGELVLRPALPLPAAARRGLDLRVDDRLAEWAETPLAERATMIVLAPKEPVWWAGKQRGPLFQIQWDRIADADPVVGAKRIGAALGQALNRVAETPGGSVVVAAIAGEPPLRAPMAVARVRPPVIRVGPGERLAMVAPRRRPGRPLVLRPRRPAELVLPAEPQPEPALDPAVVRKAAEALLNVEGMKQWSDWAIRRLAPATDDGEDARKDEDDAKATPHATNRTRSARAEIRLVAAETPVEPEGGPEMIESPELRRVLAALQFGRPKASWRGEGRAEAMAALLAHGVAATEGERPRRLRLAALPSAWGPSPGLHNFAGEEAPPPELFPGPIQAMRPAGVQPLAPAVALVASGAGQPLAAPLPPALADEVEQRYRKANFRLAVSAPLLSRLMPNPPAQADPVSEFIAGAHVRGSSTTETRLSVSLRPDPHAWRLGVVARGVVRSSTYAQPGPVTLRNHSTTSFLARKPVVIHRGGLSSDSAACDASSDTRLVGIESRFDRVPILSGVVRSRAIDGYTDRRSEAKRQSEARVRIRVANQLDEQAGPMLDRARDQYAAAVLARAAALGLSVEPMELRTTQHRLIGSVRVAGERQVAANTRRPYAPADSWASVQLHESVVNNLVAGLELGGKRFTPEELQQHVRTRLRLPEAEAAPQLRGATEPKEDAQLVFDPEEPVRVRLGDGQAELVLGIRQLRVGRQQFSRFKVHAFYEPQTEGIQARLVRTGGVQIEGRMRTGTRLRLHGVFGQVLDTDRPIPLLGPKAAADSRLAGLMVTQMVVHDGWLGMAIGPRQVAGPDKAASPLRRMATVGQYVR